VNPSFNLVHVNIATPRASIDNPIMKDFVERIDEIDTLAQSWSGFVAQPTLPDEGQIFTGNTLVNVSIWDSVENLREFTYASKHEDALEILADWFLQSELPNYVLYWAPVGEVPTEVEIKQRFDHLHLHGATPFAFSFEHPFTVEEMLDYDDQLEG
jgi:hypothetical protein